MQDRGWGRWYVERRGLLLRRRRPATTIDLGIERDKSVFCLKLRRLFFFFFTNINDGYLRYVQLGIEVQLWNCGIDLLFWMLRLYHLYHLCLLFLYLTVYLEEEKTK